MTAMEDFRTLPMAPGGSPAFMRMSDLVAHLFAEFGYSAGIDSIAHAAAFGWTVQADDMRNGRQAPGARGSRKKGLSLFEIETVMRTHPAWSGLLKFDVRHHRVMLMAPVPGCPEPPENFPRPHAGHDNLSARSWFGAELTEDPSNSDCDSAMERVSRFDVRDLVREYLESLHWDGKPRLDGLLLSGFGAEDNEWNRTVGAKFCIAAVARALRWGCKVDTMLVLEQKQGSLKTSGIEALAGHGESFFREGYTLRPGKDALAELRGPWIVEDGELNGLDKTGVEATKTMISTKNDTYRDPYAKRDAVFPRRCVFVGTTNSAEYLRDDTGGRRFWPVKVGKADLTWIRENRDQIWAEAVRRYKMKEKWYLEGAIEGVAEEQVDQRTQADSWEEIIFKWLDGEIPTVVQNFGFGDQGTKEVPGEYRLTTTVTEVLRDALNVEVGKHSKSDQTRVGIILRGRKWEMTREWAHGVKGDKFYTRPGLRPMDTRAETEKAAQAKEGYDG